MIKFKIAFKSNQLVSPVIESKLINFNGYLSYNNSSVEQGLLVNENNVREFTNNLQNKEIIDKLKTYLNQNLSKIEYDEIYYKSYKLAPILNNFYNTKIVNNIEPNLSLLNSFLVNTEQINYNNNNFDFNNLSRKQSDKKETLIEKIPEQQIKSGKTNSDYYINFSIDLKQDYLYGTDYSFYLKDIVEDGVIYKNSFVDLNKKNNPFEFWTNDKIQDNITQWKFDDNYWTGSKSEKKSISDLGFIGKVQPPFNIGDTILISQNNGAKFNEYNTEMIIEDIFYENDSWIIDVNATRLGDTPINGGIAYKYQQ